MKSQELGSKPRAPISAPAQVEVPNRNAKDKIERRSRSRITCFSFPDRDNCADDARVRSRYGEVPATFSDLEALPGVGHKTAGVVLSHAFHIPAFPVDTHIHRLAQRWKLSNGSSVTQTEADLKKLYAPADWELLHLQIITYGREHCPARSCHGLTCEICRTCFPNRRTPITTRKA